MFYVNHSSKKSWLGVRGIVHQHIDWFVEDSLARLWHHQLWGAMEASPFQSVTRMNASLPWLEPFSPFSYNLKILKTRTFICCYWLLAKWLKFCFSAVFPTKDLKLMFDEDRMSKRFTHLLCFAGHVHGNSETGAGHEGLAREGVALPSDILRYVQPYIQIPKLKGHVHPVKIKLLFFKHLANLNGFWWTILISSVLSSSKAQKRKGKRIQRTSHDQKHRSHK